MSSKVSLTHKDAVSLKNLASTVAITCLAEHYKQHQVLRGIDISIDAEKWKLRFKYGIQFTPQTLWYISELQIPICLLSVLSEEKKAAGIKDSVNTLISISERKLVEKIGGATWR